MRDELASFPDAGGYLPAGGVTTGPCIGQNGQYRAPQGVGDEDMTSGGGGGGGSTAGGSGGTIFNGLLFGAGGAAYPNEDLVPLRGGCAGGGLLGYPTVSNGGSAVQLVSRTQIILSAAAAIDMRAWIADQGGADPACFGGGSGGNVLLEAPVVVVGQGAKVLTNGAPGLLRGGGVRTSDDGTPTPGTPCPNPQPAGTRCGPGGQGAAALGGPTDGGSTQYTSGLTLLMTGGGGGALGYLRINTADGTYTKASDVLESASTSAGTLQTR
ncbi:MAG: hypothetical protein KA297_16925 [Kofleriaceae bacterium]|nr:hypothetical protein [Kofleriaceae bacterium]MBP6836713.1 hypothetical protein [Kofleriaceae bacterium]